jgi:tight adherence protein C
MAMIDLIASSPVIKTAVLFGIFAVIAFFAFVGLNLALRRRDERIALEKLVAVRPDQGFSGSLRSDRNTSAWARMAQRIEQAGLSLADSKDDRLSAKLKEAGYSSASAPRIFTLIRLTLVFALPAIVLTVMFFHGRASGIVYNLHCRFCIGISWSFPSESRRQRQSRPP